MKKHDMAEEQKEKDTDLKTSDSNEENNTSEKLDEQQDQETDENPELAALKAQLSETTKKSEEYYTLAQRVAAEFDNYKRRTVKEKEALYNEAVSDAVAAFLPVIDNLERALQAASKESDIQPLKEGIDLVFRQINGVLKNLGVEEIKSVGQKFDPELHNAVMHVEDESQDDNTIIEEFQKGYLIKDKVIRHSMVKVAN